MYSLYFADGDDINVRLRQLQPVEKVDETVEDVLAVNEPGGVLVDAERRSRLHVAQKVRLEIQGGKMQSCYFKLLKHYYNIFNLLYILK